MDSLEIIKKSWPQIEGILCNSSISLLERTNSNTVPYTYRGCGTLVAVKQRLFIATAAHVIPHNPNDGNLWILSKNPQRPLKNGVLEYLRFKKGKNVDVGYLELSPNNASDYLKCQPCPIERFRVLGPGRSQHYIALVGAPQKLVELQNSPTTRAIYPNLEALHGTSYPVQMLAECS